MRWGSPWSSGWGSPENHLTYCIPDVQGYSNSGNMYLPFIFKPRANLDGAYFSIYRNAKWQRNVFIPTNGQYSGIVDVPWGSNSVSVLPLRIGHLSDPAYSDEKVARGFEATENVRVSLQFTFTPKVFVPPLSDGGYTSSWTLTGAVQGANCAYVDGHPSWGRLGLAISVAVAGPNVTYTVTLDMNGTTVASGSATGAIGALSVTLTAQNGSGLSGSVTVNASGPVTGGTVDLRWPTSMQVLRDTFNPPTTVRDTVRFKGLNTVRWTESADLASGTYYYAVQPVSDTGITGTLSAVVSQAVTAAPAPATAFAYSSGNAAATVLSFKNSTTAGATYRLYCVTTIGAVLSLNDIRATAAAGTPGASNTITAPAISGYAGTVLFILRAVSAGIEDRAGVMIAVEYDGSGNVVLARPNNPVIETVTITSGRTAAILASYNTEHQAVAPTSIKLFKRTPSGSYNYASPDASASLVAGINGLQTATLNFTFPADGYYYVQVLAQSAAGNNSLSANATEVLVLVSNDTLPAASGVTAQLSRS